MNEKYKSPKLITPTVGAFVMVKIQTDIKKKNMYFKKHNMYLDNLTPATATDNLFSVGELIEEETMPCYYDIPEWGGIKLRLEPEFCTPIKLNPEFQTIVGWKYST